MLHYEYLKLYLQLRLKLKKIHRLLKFNQSQWLKPYIEFNTQKGQKKWGQNGKILYKLMGNTIYAIYGKTMENLRNRIDVRLVNNENTI